MSRITKNSLTSIADGAPVDIADLLGFTTLEDQFVQVQVSSGGAGTADIEVQGPVDGAPWTPHTLGLDCSAHEVVSLSVGPSEVYRNARVTFTGTTNSGVVHVRAERRVGV